MKILVTGANGFIGTYLINELLSKKEHQITALVREKSKRNGLKEDERVSVIEVDYKKEETKGRFYNQDICIHLIGQMGKYGVKEERYAPRNFYEKAKAQAEKEIISFCRT